MKLVKVLSMSAVLMVAATTQAAFSYSTGFEAGEGFALGAINGQNGYTTFAAAAAAPVISGANAASGSQHLRLPKGGAANGTLNGAFSPVFVPGANDVYTLSLDIAIGGIGGADYDIAGQDTVAGLINFRVNFSFTGDIFVQSTSGFVNTGADWVVGGYKNLTVVQDILNNSITYSYDGNTIFTDTNWNNNTSLNQIVMFSDSFHLSEFGDIDNVSLTGAEAVPEPATMTALALGLGAIAARRRRNK